MTGENESRKQSTKNNKSNKKKHIGGIAAFSLLIALFDKLGDTCSLTPAARLGKRFL